MEEAIYDGAGNLFRMIDGRGSGISPSAFEGDSAFFRVVARLTVLSFFLVQKPRDATFPCIISITTAPAA